jgi:hypothetical protein
MGILTVEVVLVAKQIIPRTGMAEPALRELSE